MAALLLAGCGGAVPTPTGPAAEPGCILPATMQELATAFRHLRAVQGHFQGGTWSDDVDAWMGRKHQVMIELGSGLVGCPRQQVVDLLGPPDQIAGPGDTVYDLVTRQAEFVRPPDESFELLIYHWRGGHDFLYFTSTRQSVLSSGWWHAYE